MYTKHFLPVLVRHIQLARQIGNLPLGFNEELGKLIWLKSSTRSGLSNMHSILIFVYYAVLLHHFCFGQLTLFQRLIGLPCLITFTALISCGWNMGADIVPVQMINSILSLEQNLIRGKISYRLDNFNKSGVVFDPSQGLCNPHLSVCLCIILN